MAAKKTYAVRLEAPEAEIFEEICTKMDIPSQRAIEEALKEYIYREQRYLKAKEECRNALQEYLLDGEAIDEEEMDCFVAEKLKSLGGSYSMPTRIKETLAAQRRLGEL